MSTHIIGGGGVRERVRGEESQGISPAIALICSKQSVCRLINAYREEYSIDTYVCSPKNYY